MQLRRPSAPANRDGERCAESRGTTSVIFNSAAQ